MASWAAERITVVELGKGFGLEDAMAFDGFALRLGREDRAFIYWRSFGNVRGLTRKANGVRQVCSLYTYESFES